MKCPKCGAEMESYTTDSDTGKVVGAAGGAALGMMVGGPIGAGIGFFLAKRLGAAAGAKLFGSTGYYCPNCISKK